MKLAMHPMVFEKTSTSPMMNKYDADYHSPLQPRPKAVSLYPQDRNETQRENIPQLPSLPFTSQMTTSSSYLPIIQGFSSPYVHEGQFEDAPEDNKSSVRLNNRKRMTSPISASTFDEFGAMDALAKLASAAATAERVYPDNDGITSGIQIGTNDVLCGRGGLTNHHPGNIHFRRLVRQLQPDYLRASKRDKAGIARQIVDNIRILNPPGRFLKKDTANPGVWKDIGNRKAREKTSQALREGAPELRETHVVCAEDFQVIEHKSQTRPITPPRTDTASGNKRKFEDQQFLSCSNNAHEEKNGPSSPRGPRLRILKARVVTQDCI